MSIETCPTQSGFGWRSPWQVASLIHGFHCRASLNVGSCLPVRCMASCANSVDRRYLILTWASHSIRKGKHGVSNGKFSIQKRRSWSVKHDDLLAAREPQLFDSAEPTRLKECAAGWFCRLLDDAASLRMWPRCSNPHQCQGKPMNKQKKMMVTLSTSTKITVLT